jgi:hypothetical protein
VPRERRRRPAEILRCTQKLLDRVLFCAQFKALGDYDHRPAREVADAAEGTAVRSVMDVDILGHIFEQFITDLESLRKNLETRDGAPTYQFKENRRLPYQFLLPAARAIALCWFRSLCSA